MKPVIMCAGMLALTACMEMPAGGGGGPTGGGYREYLVLNSKMSFEQCRARGGLIIRDQGSPMVACDPHVQGPIVPADEFNHPSAPVGAKATQQGS